MEKNIKLKKFMIASTQYTGYGGAATVAYAMIKYLRNLDYECAGLFFNKSKCVNYDPNKLGGIYLLTYLHTSYQRHIMKIDKSEFDETVKNKIIEHINSYLSREPDIIFCVGNSTPTFCRHLFPKSKIVMITSGIVHYKHNKNITSIKKLIEILNGPQKHSYRNRSYAKQEVEDIHSSNIIVPNSDLMLDVYTNIYSEVICKIYKGYFDTSKLVETLDAITVPDDIKKDIDILIISSRLDRYEKNNLFLLPILEKYEKYVKCFIGENSKQFEHIPNSIFTGLIPHKNVYEYLLRGKLLIIPSLYESSNNTVREALQCKCLILTSNNVGFYSLYPKFSICESYDINEWENKMIFILDNYYDLIDNYKINFDGSCTIEDMCNALQNQE